MWPIARWLGCDVVEIAGRSTAADAAVRVAMAAGEPPAGPSTGAVPGPVPARMHAGAADADIALAALYHAHYRALVRLAVLLAGQSVTAEEVVQDSFAAMDVITYRERDTGTALSLLRAGVVLRARSAPRRRVPAQTATTPAPDIPLAGHSELAPSDGPAVVAAIRKLADPQREVVALRYYCDLSDAQIAAAMGISTRAVSRHASRAMAALRPALERES